MTEFVIIVESEADFRTASELANRIFIEQIEWIEPYLPQQLQWRGIVGETKFTCWKDIRSIYDEMKSRGTRLPRYLGGRAQGHDYAASTKVLHIIDSLLREKNHDIQAVVLIRDLDNRPERRLGIEQARQESAHLTVVIGLADGKREAWVLNGFVCLDAREESLLANVRAELELDPVVEAHRLRATTFDEPSRIRNAKVVLDRLTEGVNERESQCWRSTSLALLRERGTFTGLTNYIREIEEKLVPVLRAGGR